MANDKNKSAREIAIERNVRWATANNLHREAIEYAKKYVSATPDTLTLVSKFYEALDFPPGPIREEHVRAAIDGVFRYIRFNGKGAEAA